VYGIHFIYLQVILQRYIIDCKHKSYGAHKQKIGAKMTDCLASTGIDLRVVAALALISILIALGIIYPSIRKKIGGLFVVGLLVFSFIGTPVHAATTCSTTTPAAAVTDTVTGTQGAALTYNVLTNDTPSVGSSFVLSSLRLALPPSSVAGSTLSSDNKTVTVPGEGMYTAGSDGTIICTPEASFVGVARGVTYTISDTSGATASSVFQPTINAATAVVAPVATNDVMGTYCAVGLGDPATNYATMLIPNNIYGSYTYCKGASYFNGTATDIQYSPSYTLLSAAVVTDQTDGTVQNAWTTHLLANDTSALAANPASVDLDPSTPGVQQSFAGSGFTAVYSPTTDTLTVTITDISQYIPANYYNVGTYEPTYLRYLLNNNVLTYQYADTAGTLSNIATVTQPGYREASNIITPAPIGPPPVFVP
jgi:CshA-type fibril repeat protein